MRVKKKLTWLLLLLRLPATHKAERVAIWRKLKKSGAIQIQTSTYVLPDEPARYEGSGNSFARSGKLISSTARGPKMWKCSCAKWKGRNQAKRRFQKL